MVSVVAQHGAAVATLKAFSHRQATCSVSYELVNYESVFGFRLALSLDHLAITAFRAIALLCSAVSRSARLLPPLDPPSLPSATAFGFFFFVMICQEF